MNDPNKLTLEKMEIHKRLLLIEQYIKEGKDQRSSINDTLTLFNSKMFGNPAAKEKIDRDGLERRIEELESRENSGKKAKENFTTIAVGSITIAVGGAVIWLFNVVKDAFIKVH